MTTMDADGIVHDFNNILATISGFAELILSTESRSGADADRVADFARMIRQAALTGQSTVRELRLITRRPEDGKEVLDLHETLEQSLEMVRGALGPGIRLTTEFLSGTARMEGNRGKLQNAFLNLLLNARDAMPGGGNISVRTFLLKSGGPDDPEVLEISVKDSGIGMSEGIRARIFDRYFSTKGKSGTGLGLANVLATVEGHGGWITVDSALGRGTEFRVHLPLLAYGP